MQLASVPVEGSVEIWWTMWLDTRSCWCLEDLSFVGELGSPGSACVRLVRVERGEFLAVMLGLEDDVLGDGPARVGDRDDLGCARRALAAESPGGGPWSPPKDSSPWRRRGAGATRRRRAARWSARRRGSTAARYGVRAVDVARISWDTRRGRDEECASLLRQQLREEACNRPKKCTYTRAFRNRPEIFVVHQRTSHDIVQKKAGRALGSSWRHVIGCFDGNLFLSSESSCESEIPRGVFVSASPRTSLVV